MVCIPVCHERDHHITVRNDYGNHRIIYAHL
jgi:hypothetical protein